MTTKPHRCERNRTSRCTCRICGKREHFMEHQGSGATTDRVLSFCPVCGYYDAYWGDTGDAIGSRAASNEFRNPPMVRYAYKKKEEERVYVIKERTGDAPEGDLSVIGTEIRDVAHENGTRHATVIVVIFDPNTGLVLVHDRAMKLKLKKVLHGKDASKTPAISYNFTGGHITADQEADRITEAIIMATLQKELQEELRSARIEWYDFARNGVGEICVPPAFRQDPPYDEIEYWVQRQNDYYHNRELVTDFRCDLSTAKHMGIASFGTPGRGNCEYSAVYALEVSAKQAERDGLVCTDNVVDQYGASHDIVLPYDYVALEELQALARTNGANGIEVADGISRLFDEENEAVYATLQAHIKKRMAETKGKGTK